MYNPYTPGIPFSPFQQFNPQSPNFYSNSSIQQLQNTQPSSQMSTPVVLQVATIKQVEQATVQPGCKALVMVANEPVIAMRTADNMGITTTDYYRIERFDPEAHDPAQSSNWVTHEELQQALDKQMQQFSEIIKPRKTKEAPE